MTCRLYILLRTSGGSDVTPNLTEPRKIELVKWITVVEKKYVLCKTRFSSGMQYTAFRIETIQYCENRYLCLLYSTLFACSLDSTTLFVVVIVVIGFIFDKRYLLV